MFAQGCAPCAKVKVGAYISKPAYFVVYSLNTVTHAPRGGRGPVRAPYSSGRGADGTVPESPRAVRDGSVGRKYTARIGVRFRSDELTESRETLGP